MSVSPRYCPRRGLGSGEALGVVAKVGSSWPHPCSQLFLKEQLYQALESKRARAHHLAALTLQRYARTFFIKRRFRSLRRKIVLLQTRARGYLARWGSQGSGGWALVGGRG